MDKININATTEKSLNPISTFEKSIFKANYQAFFVIAKKRWQIMIRYPMSMVFWLIAPALFLIPMLIFGTVLVGDRYSDKLEALTGTNDIWVYSGLGLVLLHFMWGTNWGATFAIREEEFLGTLESLYVTPPSKGMIILSNGVFALTYNGLALFIQTAVLLYLYGYTTIFRIFLALIYVLAIILMIQGISMILSILVLTLKQGWRVMFAIEVIFSIFTPASFPISVLPNWLQQISINSPFTIALEGFRNVLLFGFNPIIYSDLIKLLIWAGSTYYLGLKLFNWQEKRLRRRGSLGKY